EQYDLPMKRLFTKSFRLEHDWLLGQHCRRKLHGKRPECLGRRGYAHKAWIAEFLRIVVHRAAPSIKSKADRNPIRRKKAHDAQRTDASSRVSTEINNQAFDCAQIFRRT